MSAVLVSFFSHLLFLFSVFCLLCVDWMCFFFFDDSAQLGMLFLGLLGTGHSELAFCFGIPTVGFFVCVFDWVGFYWFTFFYFVLSVFFFCCVSFLVVFSVLYFLTTGQPLRHGHLPRHFAFHLAFCVWVVGLLEFCCGHYAEHCLEVWLAGVL